jgi:3-hydroxyisobutyrate dehydrogenase-like beta-hydroxyacid dehydrogenase
VTITDFGFIGIGRMGSLMAQRLLAKQLSLTVYDTSQSAVDMLVDAGAKPAASAADVCSRARIVFLSLPTPDIVETVCLSNNGVKDGKLVKYVVDCSTTGPKGARTVSKALAAAGIDYLDAPVSGGLTGARNGTLAIMVSGPKAGYDLVQPALANFGKTFYVGALPGQGQIM